VAVLALLRSFAAADEPANPSLSMAGWLLVVRAAECSSMDRLLFVGRSRASLSFSKKPRNLEFRK